MTPERKEEIKRIIAKVGFLNESRSRELLAALEEAQQQAAEEKKWRDVEYEVAAGYHRELIEAQQTIARQREALEKIAEDLGKLPMDHPGLWKVYNILMSELRDKDGVQP